MRRLALAVIVGSGVIAASSSACAPSPPPGPPPVRFAHAVTPALVAPDANASGPPAAGEKALPDLLNWFRAAPPSGPGAEFLVLTGDFGIGRLPQQSPSAPPATPTGTVAAPPTQAAPSNSPTGQQEAI